MDVVASRNPVRSIGLIASDIKIAHSVFALPFALLASFMAAPGIAATETTTSAWSRFAGQLVLIVLAMVFARTCAMLANRLIDRRIDANNPRTSSRALPSGRLSVGHAVTGWLLSAAVFMAVCTAFLVFYDNPWPIALGLPVLLWISAYALLKRFTWLCHLYLGSSLAISPLAAALAIDPTALTTQPALWLLAGMVLCWVAGFDVIYALQDVEIDRRDRLHSIPQRFGFGGALHIARALHLLSAACLVTASIIDPRFGIWFAGGAGIVIALLVYEHATVAKWGTTRIALVFFTLNGLISCVLGGLGIVDVLM